MATQCAAITRAGTRCPNRILPGSDQCFSHSPDLADARAKGRVEGGYGKRTERRAAKRLPQDLRDTLEALYRTLAALETGELEPSKATAIATVSRAIVAVWEAGTVEARITQIEAKVAAGRDRAAS